MSYIWISFDDNKNYIHTNNVFINGVGIRNVYWYRSDKYPTDDYFLITKISNNDNKGKYLVLCLDKTGVAKLEYTTQIDSTNFIDCIQL